MGAVINKNTEEQKVYVGNPSRVIKDSFDVFGLKADGD
jgi:acetyltransferase-like isoleucine patch superfamily enzyme